MLQGEAVYTDSENTAADRLMELLTKVYYLKTPRRLEYFLKGESRVLTYISRCPHVNAGDISAALDMTSPRVAGILRSLEKKGYILRKTGESDKRTVIVTATDEGKEFVKSGADELRRSLSELIELMGAERSELLITALGFYASAADEMDRGLAREAGDSPSDGCMQEEKTKKISEQREEFALDMHSFYMGDVFDAYKFFGAHTDSSGTVFRTFAPNAFRVTIIGEWNGWKEEEMTKSGQIFTYSSSEAVKGQMYKYVIYSRSGRAEHCDPYGFAMELRPAFASIITNLLDYRFTDEKWMESRTKNYDEPMNIYEVHLGSWLSDPDNENGWYTYSEIADKLIKYVREHGYTHIEFMPLSEYPADCSWGYQSTGFFAPTARYGKPSELMELVDKCHNSGIGVIMDFVPVHFAVDGYALANYDGTPLYEYPSGDVTVSEWGSCNFIHSRREVCCFLQSAANYWLTEYHFDGLRMDAISRAIYWSGDPARGVNGCTVDFLKKMNEGLHKLHPTAMLMAEDSTSFPKITAPVEYSGLGFDYKWDMGWMNDTLDYFRTPPSERKNVHGKITFSMHYFYNELYLLPISHDENVHGKATLIQKMWGDYEVKFPQARAFYMYMYTHPGKKLNFMGGEFAQFREWDETREQDWDLLRYPLHDSFLRYVTDLSKLYDSRPSLHKGEYDQSCFKWILPDERETSVFVYKRTADGETTVVFLNLSDKPRTVTIPAGDNSEMRELLNSDSVIYSGSTEVRSVVKAEKKDGDFIVSLSPFSGRLFDAAKKKVKG